MLCHAKGKMGGHPILPSSCRLVCAKSKSSNKDVRHVFDSQNQALSNEPITSRHTPSIDTQNGREINLVKKKGQKVRSLEYTTKYYQNFLLSLGKHTWLLARSPGMKCMWVRIGY